MEPHRNLLIQEKSPYLLQHADNPVNWYPWGEEAFQQARNQDKPIFLSIGYSTCHWCHVMAHESFENQQIADLFNQWFICIKVDREERPDIDQMYMAATQAMTGGGGWPMSVFLFPDGRPFYAATYIPPVSMYGRPGLPDLLDAVQNAWCGKREDLSRTAESLINALQKEQGNHSAVVRSDVNDRAFQSLLSSFDAIHGGFGQAPKFPRPVVFHFLLRYYFYTSNGDALNMTRSTLDGMARGGMYDHLGGGFHRYSVDGQWRVPHFEKMLYDQSQLAGVYVDVFQITGKKKYASLAGEIFNYVLRDMRDPAGGFYSAEDADSVDPYAPEKRSEGAYFLWTEKEIVTTLGAEQANIFSFCYGIQFDGNALHDPQNEFTGRNILFLQHTPQEAADHFGLNIMEIEEILSRAKQMLLTKRKKRIRPHCDDKVLTGWNGLMIGALAKGGLLLDRPDILQAAQDAAHFIRQFLYNAETGLLARRYREGQAGHSGQLDDYAFLVAGLLELYQALHDPDLLSWAISITQTQIELFWDAEQGGFFDSVEDEHLPLRLKGDYDGAEPAANSIAAKNLLQLGRITDNEAWLTLADQTIEAFSSRLNGLPEALLEMLCVVSDRQERPEQVVIAGQRGEPHTEAMLKAASSSFHPGRIVLYADGEQNQELLSGYLPFMRSVTMHDNRATAYVCRDFTCTTPVTDVSALAELLDGGE